MLPYGTPVRTHRNNYEHGIVVGYGTILWPASQDSGNGDPQPVPVYLVKVDGIEGSAYGQRAVLVFRADSVEVL